MDISPYNPGAGETEVRCEWSGARPGLWISFLLSGVLCLSSFLVPPGANTLTAFSPFALHSGLFLLLMSGILLIRLRADIIADEAGLRWRYGWRWRSTPWEGVRDYYDRLPSPNGNRASEGSYVETQAGQLRMGTGRWSNEAKLRAFIRQRAVAAKPAYWGGAWGVRGERPSDWPLVFHYDTILNRHTLPWLRQWHQIGLAAAVVYFGWRWETTHTLPGWGWLLTPTGLFFVGKQVLPLLIRSTYQETHRRLKQKIRVDAEGLTFINGPERVLIAWDQITDLYQKGLRSVIVTAGGEWDFVATLTDIERLRRIIPLYAVNAGQTKWRTQNETLRQIVGNYSNRAAEKAREERRWTPR